MRIYKAILLILLVGGIARADYHYASHEGSNEYPYTSWETAAHLIQDAVDASSPHDTVYIGAGEWYETVSTWVHDSIGVVGMGMDSTLLYTDVYQTAALDLGDNCIVEGIRFRHDNNWRPLDTAIGVITFVRNCKFVNSRRGVFFHSDYTEITNCIFDSCNSAIVFPGWRGSHFISNNLITNLTGSGGEAMLLWVYSAIVQNNIIVIDPQASNSGIISSILEGPVILRNNIVINGVSSYAVDSDKQYGNLTYSSRWGLLSHGGDSVYNNVSVNCRDKGFRIADGTVHFLYNAAWNNGEDIYIDPSGDIDSIGNLFVNPMFRGSDDFHLQAFSPLIDAGLPSLFDLDGTRSDIGPYGGPYGEIYEYQDLPPAIPDSLLGYLEGDSIVITWRFNSEADFSNYFIYRDTLSGFEPSEFNLIFEPDTSIYIDEDIMPGIDYYYRISALDNQENESDYSVELAVIQTAIWNGSGPEMPQISAIESNYPNPFNSRTTIIYFVADLGPIPAQIKISIYDIMGRKVRTLVDERKEVGTHKIIWDGKDDAGHDCNSGIYFTRMTQWDMQLLSKHQKLVLIK